MYHRKRTLTASLTSVLVMASLASGDDCQPAWIPTFVGGNSVSGTVISQAVFNDGAGDALFVGGTFITAGGQTVNRIARWNGASWSPLGSGLGNNAVLAMATFDDGSGEALYVGGSFATAGGQTVNGIAKWNGTSWSPLGSGVSNGFVFALTVFDDGNGPALYAAGSFTQAGGNAASRIARWNGSAWTPLDAGVNDSVSALTVFDDGTGPALYAGGSFTQAGGNTANRIARWDGSAWTTVGSGVTGGATSPSVQDFAIYNSGAGDALYVGGIFASAGGVSGTSRIARWDGSAWSSVGSGITDSGFNQGVRTLTVYDDGSGAGLYAGGDFFGAGGVSTSLIARWNGSAWSPLGAGMLNIDFAPVVRTIGVYDSGSGAGPALFAGGASVGAPGGGNYLGRWQGCPVTAEPCPADLTGPELDGTPDGSVNAFDLNYYIGLWLADDPAADLTGPALDGVPNGIVDAFDLNYYLNLWLNTQGPCP